MPSPGIVTELAYAAPAGSRSRTVLGSSGAEAAPAESLASTSIVTSWRNLVVAESAVATGVIGVTMTVRDAVASLSSLLVTRYPTVPSPVNCGSGSKVTVPSALAV